MSMSEDHEFDPQEYAEQLGYVDEQTKNDFTEPGAERAKSPGELRVSRRDLLVKGGVGAAAVAGLGALAGPAAGGTSSAEQYTGTLNMISLGVEWPPGAEQQAEKELGVKFNVQLMGTNAQVQKSITAPRSFDIGGLYNYQFQPIWPTGNFQPVDRLKIRAWKDFYPIFSKGKVLLTNRGCTQGQGDAPYRMLYVDPNGSTGLPKTKEAGPQNRQIVQWWNQATNKPFGGKPQPRWLLGPPAHFNMDSMGYDGSVLNKAPGQVSWAELLNTKWKGRVAVLNDPAIAMDDLGNAVKALGLMKIKDLGNMTRGEMDRLFKILTKYKKDGQFRAFWATFNESVNLMASKEVVIESMWSPAVALLVAQGVDCRYAFPKEGIRGWCSSQGIPEPRDGRKARGGLPVPQLDVRGLARCADHAAGLLHRERQQAPLLDPEERVPGRAGVHEGRVRLLVPRQAGRTRPARHHGQGGRHQEGTAAATEGRSSGGRASTPSGTRSTSRTCTR